jgi:hypothetical protein
MTNDKNDYFPNLNELSIIGSSPLTPTSSTDRSSGASDVVNIKG